MDETSKVQNTDRVTDKSSILFIAVGWVAAMLSLIIYPFIFGVVGVVMGILASKKGNRVGLSVIVSNIICMGIGLLFSGVILTQLRLFLGL